MVLIALGAWLTAAGCNRRGDAAQATGGMQMPPALVTSAAVETRDVPFYLDQIGRCAAREMVAVQSQVSGQITEIHVKDGQDVKKGDLLFTIDPRPFQAALAQAQAAKAQNQATLELAQLNFDRIKDLPRSVEPQEDNDLKKNAITVSQAQIQANEAAIQIATINLNYCTIRSPIDGLAGQRLVDTGNIVNSQMNTVDLLTIQRLDPIYADFTVTENDLPSVREHMATGTLKTQVRLPSDKDPREGELSFLDNAVQEGTGTVKLRATLPNKDRHFWPGQFVFVRLVLDVKKDALLVPATAIQIGQQGTFVYVIKPDHTAELRPVVTGQRQGELMVIQKGIDAGERVIATGQMLVRPGGPVMEKPTAPMTGAPGPGPTTQPAPTTQPQPATTREAA